MRKQTQQDLKNIYDCEDMLKGCICRMCVTDSMAELNERTLSAIRWIEKIREINYDRLTEDYEPMPESSDDLKESAQIGEYDRIGDDLEENEYDA